MGQYLTPMRCVSPVPVHPDQMLSAVPASERPGDLRSLWPGDPCPVSPCLSGSEDPEGSCSRRLLFPSDICNNYRVSSEYMDSETGKIKIERRCC